MPSGYVLMRMPRTFREKVIDSIVAVAEKLVELYNRDFFWAEALSGFSLILFSTLDLLSNSPISLLPRYSLLLQLMPKHAWDALCLLIGIQQWWALYTDHVWGRLTSSIAACYLVSIVCISVTFSVEGGPPPGIAWPASYIITNMVSIVRNATRIRNEMQAKAAKLR